MGRFTTLVIAIGVLLCGVTGMWGQDAEQELSFPQQLQQWLPGLGAEKIPDRQESQQALQDAVFRLGAPGREAELIAACKLIAEKLGPTTAKSARVWMLRQLEFSGGAECVEAVAALLKDEDAQIRDCARRALQNNPAPEANARLLAELHSTADDARRVAIINALGYRADQSSTPVLCQLLDQDNEAVVTAAANALGKIGGMEAGSALHAALAKAPESLKTCLANALLRCADDVRASGEGKAAMAVYLQFVTNYDQPRPLRLAAIQGMLNALGDDAHGVLFLLAIGDPVEEEIATGHAGNVSGAEAIRVLVAGLPKLKPQNQILLLGALAANGDKAAMPAAMGAAADSNEDVRLAGIRALAKLGDASAVPLLVRELAAGGATSESARESLRGIYGEGVDEAIADAMPKAEIGLKGALIDVLDDRRAVQAVSALLKEAAHEDAGIRSRAMRALGDVAEPKDVAAMVEILRDTEKGRERDDAEKAIVLVCNRIPKPDERAAPVIDAMSPSDSEDRCSLLPLLGRIGGDKALAEVRRAIKDEAPAVQEAGVRALCNWPDASVADELLDLARQADNETHRIWALRAYVRVVTLPGDRPHTETLALLQKAMEMADRDDEKKLILSRASSARHLDTLHWLAPFLDDPALSAPACGAVVDLAHHRDLMAPNQAEFRKALNKVIAVSKDKGLVERARQYMSGL